MVKVVIFGTGDIGELAHYYLTNDSPYEIVAFSADSEYIDDPEFLGLPVVSFDEVVDKFPPSDFKMFVALSYSQVKLG